MQPTTLCDLLQKMDKRGDYAFMMEKGMATHSSTLAWRIPWTEKSDMTGQHTHTHTHVHTRMHTHIHKHTHL